MAQQTHQHHHRRLQRPNQELEPYQHDEQQGPQQRYRHGTLKSSRRNQIHPPDRQSLRLPRSFQPPNQRNLSGAKKKKNQSISIMKPGKPPDDQASYRLISLTKMDIPRKIYRADSQPKTEVVPRDQKTNPYRLGMMKRDAPPSTPCNLEKTIKTKFQHDLTVFLD